jgi:hypothetical protein
MATRQTTTKAKTKTSPKASKARPRTAAAKTTRNTSKTAKPSKKAVATKKTAAKAVAATKTVSALARLRTLNLISLLAFALLAALAIILMRDTSAGLHVGYLTRDELASDGGTAFGYAIQPLLSIELRWLVAAVMALSAILPFLYGTRLRRSYEAALDRKMVPWRWLDLGVTGALMVSTVALLSGIHDIFVLKLVAGLAIVTAALKWLSERQNSAVQRPVWGSYLTAVFAGTLPWLLIGSYAVFTWVYGLVRYPWYVYALIGAVLGGFTLVALNQLLQLKARGRWADYSFVERNYLVINFVMKAAFAAILIVGLQRL